MNFPLLGRKFDSCLYPINYEFRLIDNVLATVDFPEASYGFLPTIFDVSSKSFLGTVKYYLIGLDGLKGYPPLLARSTFNYYFLLLFWF